MRHAKPALGLLLSALALAVPAWAAIIHVPGDQPTIQAGIDAAVAGDVVLVAPGTYTGPGNKDLDFGNKNLAVRSEAGAAATFIDCEQSGRAFVLHGTLTAAARVDGFTIRNGDGGGGESDGGGGMLIYGADPSIANCVFSGNTAAGSGGGIACYSS